MLLSIPAPPPPALDSLSGQFPRFLARGVRGRTAAQARARAQAQAQARGPGAAAAMGEAGGAEEACGVSEEALGSRPRVSAATVC